METINEKENKILDFWKKSKTFEQSVEKNSPKGDYIFYDGPPFITGLPHYATLLPSIVKDAVPRFWTMNGYSVKRVWGWDCHGLPAENKVEKELNLKNKKEIEKLGIGKFVCACKDYVNNVSSQWQWYIDKIARWVDMDNAYKTMDLNFMESVLWNFKQLYDKGLIYEGFRSSLHCSRCATPLSKFEITMDAGSYQDVTEMSVVVKFPVKSKDATILAWTTTPWTLPANLALAVNEKIDYVLVKFEGEKYILAKERAKAILKDNFEVLEEFKGKELVGKSYEPLFDLNNSDINENENVYKIYSEDFVNVEDGTGIVHIAPNFGEDDFELGKKYNLPIKDLMDENGAYTGEAGEWNGIYFKDAGKKVMQELGDKLFSKFNYTHSYPFCYRCSTPLIYKTQKAWYLDTDKIRDEMIKNNENINWVPEHFKEGRFKYNLENAPHWCLSRSRYWGSPIPVWKCEDCGEIKVVGSIKEIEDLSGKKVTDLHRPEIDEFEFNCKCGKKMKRIPEILDCWFESGSMPTAQHHYPFEKKDEFDKIFPADFIIEYTGQLRGWFYYLHAVSNGLFDSECFKNVIVTGVLAGTDGRKMSKSYGNYPDPKETLEKYGGDALRMYFLNSPIINGGDMSLNEKDIQDSLRKNVMMLSNVLNFFEQSSSDFKLSKSKNLLDKWIIYRLNELGETITENMKKYDLPSATRPITGFIEDLSTWYVRLNRDRLNNKDSEALSTLKYILEELSKTIAPFMPYLAEDVWQKITNNNYEDKTKSVHLENWPTFDKYKIEEDILKKMALTREIVSLGLREREMNQTGLKWPLQSAKISSEEELSEEYLEIIKQELNIKDLEYSVKEKTSIEMNFEMTPELLEEGYAREISRKVQAFRKKLGLNKDDLVEILIITNDKFQKTLENKLDFIKERTNSSDITIKSKVTTDEEKFKNKIDFKIKEEKGVIIVI